MATAQLGPDPGDVARLWWLRLAVGIGWSIAALIILQFDDASAKTVGVILGSLQKAYVLLVFAGVWALLQGVVEIVRAFAVRAARD